MTLTELSDASNLPPFLMLQTTVSVELTQFSRFVECFVKLLKILNLHSVCVCCGPFHHY